MVITKAIFKAATGFDPVNDDLERCNCPHAGELTHSCCGWHKSMNLPQFMVGPRYITKTEEPDDSPDEHIR